MERILKNTVYLLGIYLTGIIFFTVFRIVLIYSYISANDTYTFLNQNMVKSFAMGFRFDTVISCYILIIPALILAISSFFRKSMKRMIKGIMIWSLITYTVSFIFTAANIPYYIQFNKQINASIWNWMSEPQFVIRMIFSEDSFLIYILLLLILMAAYYYIIIKWTKRHLKVLSESDGTGIKYVQSAIFSILLLFSVFLGIRGRLAIKSPIRIGTAYFCNDQFLNQAGLNPVFVLIKTSMDINKENSRIISIADEYESYKKAATILNMTTDSIGWSRKIPGDSIARKKNVVVILMESFCSDLLEWKEGTPFVNRLTEKSVYFRNTYSAGIHTMNGIHSTLFGFPALMNQHPMKIIRTFKGMPASFVENGYSTMYFTTHDEQFDNVSGFLIANGIESVYGQKDYPLNEVKSNLGVVDDYMLKYAVNKISERHAADKKPFFATLLTASNHQPYIIPDYYKPDSEDIRKQIVEYSDWAISQFFEMAEKEDWYNNTLFVLLGDHGSPSGLNIYDVSLIYHQIPLIFYEPGEENNARTINDVAGQIDVYPTIMGWVGLPYENETFGVDLMKEKRKYIYFSSDDSYACVDTSYYYVNRMDGRESLYNYSVQSPEDSISFHKDKANEMNNYAKTMIQAAQYIIKNK